MSFLRVHLTAEIKPLSVVTAPPLFKIPMKSLKCPCYLKLMKVALAPSRAVLVTSALDSQLMMTWL